MNATEIEKIRHEIQRTKLERHNPLTKMLKEELSKLGRWRIKPRGKANSEYWRKSR
jgi:hypothetical protein